MVAYNGAAVFYFFYIVLSTTLIKNKYSEKETPGHFEKKVCQWRVIYKRE
jgi:hypothetical protein